MAHRDSKGGRKQRTGPGQRGFRGCRPCSECGPAAGMLRCTRSAGPAHTRSPWAAWLGVLSGRCVAASVLQVVNFTSESADLKAHRAARLLRPASFLAFSCSYLSLDTSISRTTGGLASGEMSTTSVPASSARSSACVEGDTHGNEHCRVITHRESSEAACPVISAHHRGPLIRQLQPPASVPDGMRRMEKHCRRATGSCKSAKHCRVHRAPCCELQHRKFHCPTSMQ